MENPTEINGHTLKIKNSYRVGDELAKDFQITSLCQCEKCKGFFIVSEQEKGGVRTELKNEARSKGCEPQSELAKAR